MLRDDFDIHYNFLYSFGRERVVSPDVKLAMTARIGLERFTVDNDMDGPRLLYIVHLFTTDSKGGRSLELNVSVQW